MIHHRHASHRQFAKSFAEKSQFARHLDVCLSSSNPIRLSPVFQACARAKSKQGQPQSRRIRPNNILAWRTNHQPPTTNHPTTQPPTTSSWDDDDGIRGCGTGDQSSVSDFAVECGEPSFSVPVLLLRAVGLEQGSLCSFMSVGDDARLSHPSCRLLFSLCQMRTCQSSSLLSRAFRCNARSHTQPTPGCARQLAAQSVAPLQYLVSEL